MFMVASVLIRPRTILAIVPLLFAGPLHAHAQRISQADYMAAANHMMEELAPQSAHASIAIRDTYTAFADLLVLNEYGQIEGALANGGLAPLPADPRRFNLRPRLEGANPIGEKDLGNQASYLSARPATIGCLLAVASRVTSGPVEVTSLVRHAEYQDALRATNWNATTNMPMHTMGLAFDIAIVNTPLQTVYEIRDVLRQMRDAGDILFIGERRQLVFHVVPHPSRLGYFTDLYVRTIGTERLFVIPFDPALRLTPLVTAEISALRPTLEFAPEWWAADNVPVDLAIEVTPELVRTLPVPAADLAMPSVGARASQYFGMLGEILASTWEKIAGGLRGDGVRPAPAPQPTGWRSPPGDRSPGPSPA